MSYAKIDKEKVITACENYLLRRKARIEREKEVCILEAMKPKWYRRARTREEAIRYLKQDIWNQYNMVEVTGGYWASAVGKLLSLAKASDGEVLVTAEMAHTLFRTSKEKQ